LSDLDYEHEHEGKGGGGGSSMARFIAATFLDRAQAERVVYALKDAGIASKDISLVARETLAEDVRDRDREDENQAFTGIAVSAAWDRVGWQVGGLPEFRTQVAPDVTMVLIAAGPIAISLGGAQIGATGGGLVGSLNNFGIPLEVGRAFQERVHAGQPLVGVLFTPESPPSNLRTARQVLEQFGGEQITSS
jgi:hypothetical protein